MVESDAVGLLTLDEHDVSRMKTLMQKYRDLPMDLADAALVRVAEREKIPHRIFTWTGATFGRTDRQVSARSRFSQTTRETSVG